MSYVPSVRSIREAILEQARQSQPDPVAQEALRASVIACVRGMRRSIDRACEFAQLGLVSEAAGLVEDYPDLARQAQALMMLPACDPTVHRIWTTVIDVEPVPLPIPTPEEVDALASFGSSAETTRQTLDALRIAVLRGEPVLSRLRILRRIRATDPRNRMWLDQIEHVEQEWIKQIANLRSKAEPSREELDEALAALDANEWIASVPRGLKEEIYQRVKPLRAGEAVVRYREIAARVHDAAQRMDRAEITALEAEWAKVNQETGRMPDVELAESVAPAFDWLTRLEQEERAQAEFEGQSEVLEQMLQCSRPVGEIERQLSVLRDAGRPAREGLVDRAIRYIDAERIRLRRRHRIIVVSALLTACVLLAVGLVALQLHNRQQRAAADLAALKTAVQEGDAFRARELAEAIKDRVVEPDADLQATIAAAMSLYEARVARTDELRSAIERFRSELERVPARARLVAMQAELDSLKPDAEESEARAITELEALRGQKLAAAEEAIERAVDAALASVESAVDSQPGPDRWSDAQQLDPVAWKGYIALLERQMVQLRDAGAAAEGMDSLALRLTARSDSLNKRKGEADLRLRELESALAALKPEVLLRRVSSELEFMERIELVLKNHSAVLARQRLLSAFESSAALKDGLVAVEAWRSEYRPRLGAILGAALAAVADEDRKARALEVVQEYNGRFPANPYRSELERMAEMLKPGEVVQRWGPPQFQDALLRARLSELHEVPLKEGRRFYRRPPTAPNPPPNQLNPLNRAVATIADLTTDAARLPSILTVTADQIIGKSRFNSVSRLWQSAQEDFANAGPAEVSVLALGLLSSLIADRDADVLMRFRAVYEYTDVLLKSGHLPESAADDVKDWRDRTRKNSAKALVADWLRAAWDDPISYRDERTEADLALKGFPDIALLVKAAEGEARRALNALEPRTIVGVLAPRVQGSSERSLFGQTLTGTFWVLVRRGGQWSFSDASFRQGILLPGPTLPDGPLLIHRTPNEVRP